MKKFEYSLITQADALQEVCQKATAQGIVSMDTEFMRERVFYAELCLLQIGIGEEYFLIDTIAFDSDKDLEPLADLLANPDVIKIFHSCSQDVDVLFHRTHVTPQNIFDTQLAAAFCGYDGQVGYANLVAEICDVELDKSQTRTDWLRRPLSEKQLDYAVNDVVYLPKMYQVFAAKLEELGRVEWFEQESKDIINTIIENDNPDTAYKRLNGGSMSVAKQSLLQFLANLREKNAQDYDKPRPWILKDSDLYDIVAEMPTNEQALFALSIRSGFIQNNATAIVEFVNNIDPKNKTAIWKEARALTPEQKADVKLVSKRFNQLSEDKGVARGIIANRKDIEAFLRGHEVRFLKGWRAELFGSELMAELKDLVR